MNNKDNMKKDNKKKYRYPKKYDLISILNKIFKNLLKLI